VPPDPKRIAGDRRRLKRRPGHAPVHVLSSQRPLWLFLTEPGLGPLLVKELKFLDAVGQKAQLTKLHLRNYDLLVAPDAVVGAPKVAPRLALHVLTCPVFGRERVTERQLELLAKFAIREKAGRLVTSIAGAQLSRPEFTQWIVRGLADRGVTLSDESARSMWLLAVDEKYYLGFPRFNYHDAKGRDRLSEREGSLPPAIAAAIVFAAKPGSAEVIWDPVMGTGTVLAEAAAFAPDARLIGTDIDPTAVAAARKRLGRRDGVRLLQNDAAHAELGDARLTLTLANLPFGKRSKSAGGNRALYESILRRSLAQSAENWRACVLTSDDEALRAAVEAAGNLALTEIAEVAVRGLKAAIWLVTRR
jgi:predicted RNA methylase